MRDLSAAAYCLCQNRTKTVPSPRIQASRSLHACSSSHLHRTARLARPLLVKAKTETRLCIAHARGASRRGLACISFRNLADKNHHAMPRPARQGAPPKVVHTQLGQYRLKTLTGPGGPVEVVSPAGLEPELTGPKPVVLPITPPGNAWAKRIRCGRCRVKRCWPLKLCGTRSTRPRTWPDFGLWPPQAEGWRAFMLLEAGRRATRFPRRSPRARPSHSEHDAWVAVGGA